MIYIYIIAIEDEYEGPCLEDGKVTLKFVTELMEYYKEQKKLHKKYAYKVAIILLQIYLPIAICSSILRDESGKAYCCR